MNELYEFSPVMFQRCMVMLTSLVGTNEETIEKWWYGQNRGFDMQTPASVFMTDPQRVFDYLYGYLQR
jgi:hypothetical protein